MNGEVDFSPIAEKNYVRKLCFRWPVFDHLNSVKSKR